VLSPPRFGNLSLCQPSQIEVARVLAVGPGGRLAGLIINYADLLALGRDRIHHTEYLDLEFPKRGRLSLDTVNLRTNCHRKGRFHRVPAKIAKRISQTLFGLR
jgi:hypothetical protein